MPFVITVYPDKEALDRGYIKPDTTHIIHLKTPAGMMNRLRNMYGDSLRYFKVETFSGSVYSIPDKVHNFYFESKQ